MFQVQKKDVQMKFDDGAVDLFRHLELDGCKSLDDCPKTYTCIKGRLITSDTAVQLN